MNKKLYDKIVASHKPIWDLEKDGVSPELFENIQTTLQDFTFYFTELKDLENKAKNDGVEIISAQEILEQDKKNPVLDKETISFLKKQPKDHLFLIDSTKLGVKMRRSFENTLFRVSMYKDNVTIVVNELGYFWLKKDSRIFNNIKKSKRILLYRELREVLNILDKPPVSLLLELRNKITHKTHLHVDFEVEKDKEKEGGALIMGKTYESKSSLNMVAEDVVGPSTTIHDYIDLLEKMFDVFRKVNELLTTYYKDKYSPDIFAKEFEENYPEIINKKE